MAARQFAQINTAGVTPELEIQIGNANIAAYRVFRWDADRRSVLIGQWNNVDAPGSGLSLGVPAHQLVGATISYEVILQSPNAGAGQPYGMCLSVRQDGAIVPGGVYWEIGKLNEDGAKSAIGFISFKSDQQSALSFQRYPVSRLS